MTNTILTEIDALKAKLSTIRPLPSEAVKKIQDAIENIPMTATGSKGIH